MRDERVPTRDGTLLAADVCVDRRAAPRPALLIRTPYSRQTARDAYDLVGLARGGWSVVVQDVRGRYDSDGDFDCFTQEADDGADAVDWCAAQPWCDGRVVMTGVSYLGGAQWAAASRKPASLVAINPLLAPSAPPETVLYQGGAFQLGLAQSWMLAVLATDPRPSLTREAARELAGDWHRALRTTGAADPVRSLSPTYARWRDAVAGSSARVADSWLPVDRPAFQVVGWYDVFCESGIAAHVRQAEAGVPVVTVVGPWTHNERLTNLSPEWDFGPLGSGELTDLRGEGWSWLHARLAGEPVESQVRYFVMGLDEWRSSSSWPPRGVRTRKLFLSAGAVGAAGPGSDGRLTGTPPLASGIESWRHDPDDPVPSWGGRILGPMLPLAGPTDQRRVQQRPDVLVFTSSVLQHALDVVGEVHASVVVSSTAPSMDVTVKLCDVHPDGRAFNVVDGVQRVTLPSGGDADVDSVDVVVGTTAHVFRPGHRIRVEVAGSNFPRFELNPCTGESGGAATTYAVAQHRLHWGGRALSCLELPVQAGPLPT